MKYGINIVENRLKAISEFPEGIILPNEFQEITEEQYYNFINGITSFSVWDEDSDSLVESEILKKEFELQSIINQEKALIESKRTALATLVTEIALAERLGEDTTVLQAQFIDIEKEYKGIANIPPVVYAGQSQTISSPINSITLSGTATDKDGQVVTTKWSKLQGQTGTIEKPNELSTKINGLQEGNYTFRLTATDDKGDSASSDVRVEVKPEEQEIPIPTSSLSISPMSKRTLPIGGSEFPIKITSNTSWSAVGKQNSSVSPSSGNGNATVTVRVHQNNSGVPVDGIVEFKTAAGEIVNLTWNQEGNS